MENQPSVFTIQGIGIDALAREFGTPLYVYDAQKILSQLELLKSVFRETNFRIMFAAKALTNVSILRLLKKNGACIDAVSINEVRLALKAGFNPGEIMFTPNNADFEEIEDAVKLGVEITLDNLSSLEKFGQQFGSTIPLGIRLNPHIMAGGNLKISTGHSNSKFGISIQQQADIFKQVNKYKLIINGLHIHTGSEIVNVEIFMKMAGILLEIAPYFPDLKFVDFGGGLKVAYKKDDDATDIQLLGKNLSEAINNYCKKFDRKLELRIEPGKFLVSEAGFLIARATVVKQTPTLTFVGVNSGLNHLIRPMMYDAYHEIINGSNMNGPLKTYNVVGNICETDTLGADRKLNTVTEGDLMVIKNAGAYGYTMASNYNSRARPAEVLLVRGKPQLIRSRESFDDLLRHQIEIDL